MTEVTKFGGKTQSEAYMTCEVGGKWFFCPTDNDWLAFNGNDSFSAGFATEAEAIDAAELWELNNGEDAE